MVESIMSGMGGLKIMNLKNAKSKVKIEKWQIVQKCRKPKKRNQKSK